MKKFLFVGGLVLFLLFAQHSTAFAAKSSGGSSRSRHPIGAYFALVGDPFPSAFGANLGLNLTDWLRLEGGTGVTISVLFDSEAYGGGAAFFVPGADFSPTVGIHYSHVEGDFLGIDLDRPFEIGYVNAGFDYTAPFGFNLGFGVDVSFTQNVKTLIGPYAHIGWYF